MRESIARRVVPAAATYGARVIRWFGMWSLELAGQRAPRIGKAEAKARYGKGPSVFAPMRLLAILSFMLVLAGCGAGDSSTQTSVEADESDTVGLSLFGLNYTDVPIGVFYVNGVWGGNSNPYAAGLSTAGSIGLPAKWHPGIKVKVQWRDDLLYDQDKDALTTAEVEAPRYGKIYSGYLLVAFLPGRKVKVYASGVGPGHKDAPDGLENPGEFCQRQAGCPQWYRSEEPPREGHY